MRKIFTKLVCFSIATVYSLLYVVADYKCDFIQASAFSSNNVNAQVQSQIQNIEDIMLIPLGNSFGIKLYTDGVIVSSLQNIITANGSFCPAKDAGINEGDYILAVNGINIESGTHFSSLIYDNLSKDVNLKIKRDDEVFETTVTPVFDGKTYKIGLWIKDSAAGIGTLTFAYPNSGVFAGLGHAICDSDTGDVMNLKGGFASPIIISDIVKATGSETGKICGYFANQEPIGILCQNNCTGIFGVLNKIPNIKPVHITSKDEVHKGSATILTTLDNEKVQNFTAEIISIAKDKNALTKNFVVKITDEKLLGITGGIVQGMSGSPILQDGKLVGAITHVFVNDPTKGYGIFVENMLSTAKNIN